MRTNPLALLTFKCAVWLLLSLAVSITMWPVLAFASDLRVAALVGVHLGIMHGVRLAGPEVRRLVRK